MSVAEARTVGGRFTPMPGAAPLPRMVLAQGLMETRLLLRNGEQLLLALVIPLLVLLGGAYGPMELSLSKLVPGVMALAVMSTAFTSLAIATAFERRYGVLKRLGASPLPRSGLLAGKAFAVLLVELLQLVVIGAVALLIGWRPSPAGFVPALALIVLGTVAFASLGLLMAGTLRAEATLASANLVYLLLLAGGAVLAPVSAYPSAMQPFISLLPSGALAEGLRAAASSSSLALPQLGILALWAIVGGVLTAKTFKWA